MGGLRNAGFRQIGNSRQWKADSVRRRFVISKWQRQRVGITPHPSKLCTDVAKTKKMIQWADGRASFRVVPKFVLEEWGIDLAKERAW